MFLKLSELGKDDSEDLKVEIRVNVQSIASYARAGRLTKMTLLTQKDPIYVSQSPEEIDVMLGSSYITIKK